MLHSVQCCLSVQCVDRTGHGQLPKGVTGLPLPPRTPLASQTQRDLAPCEQKPIEYPGRHVTLQPIVALVCSIITYYRVGNIVKG